MQHPPADAVGPAEQALGQGKIAGSQRLAHPRAADALAVLGDGGRRLDGETLARAGLDQQGEIAGAALAEAEIVADLQMLDAEPLDQDLANELPGGQLAQAAVEGQAQHPVDAGLAQQFELLAQAADAPRGLVRGKEFARLRLEDHHAAGQPGLRRTLAQARQDTLVTAVHAVEIANGGNAAALAGTQIVETSNQLHRRVLCANWPIIPMH
ncbi:hypothetical protein D3C81_1532680 [compost metagenome]